MPVRNNFAAGEVLAAADLNDTFASKADYPTGGSNGQALVKSGTSTAWAAVIPANGVSTVATEQTTSSTTYTDLATSGPGVTLTTGTKALVIITSTLYNDTSGQDSYVSFAVSGSSTVSASDDRSIRLRASGTLVPIIRVSSSQIVTGLTAGSNTFTMKYRVTGGTGGFLSRTISVIDMGS